MPPYIIQDQDDYTFHNNCNRVPTMGFIENHFFFKNKKSPPTSLRIAPAPSSPPTMKRRSSRSNFFLKVVPNQADVFLEPPRRAAFMMNDDDDIHNVNPASYASDDDEVESVTAMMASNTVTDTTNPPTNDTTTAANATASSRKKKSVSFANVSVRQHEVILGDHPCCTIGLPISLGWTIVHERTVTLPDFEHSKQLLLDTNGGRRRRGELRLSYEERRILLQDYSEQDVRRVSRKLFRERRCSNTSTRKTEAFFSMTTETAPAPVVATAPVTAV